MQQIEYAREIAIQRPGELAPSNLLQRKIDHKLRVRKKERYDYEEYMPEIMEKTRKLLFEVASELDLDPTVYEYDVPSDTGIPSRTAVEWMKGTNVLMIFDPNDEQIAQTIACLRENPVLTVILAATNGQYLHDRKAFLQTQISHLLHNAGKIVQRIHPTSIQWKHEEDIETILKKALVYPYEAI